jgi:hypothetical protein
MSLLDKYSADLLILDPALSYIGGNANEQEIVGGFLRNNLNPFLQRHNCGVLVVHHTSKPNAERDGKKKIANDFAYAGTGSAEWANWARAVLVLQAKNDDGLRLLQIGKRFRLGWMDAEGKPTSAIGSNSLLREMACFIPNSRSKRLFWYLQESIRSTRRCTRRACSHRRERK